MNSKRNLIFYSITILIIMGCKLIDSHFGTNYEITKDYIRGKEKIKYFNIAELEVYDTNRYGIPSQEVEVARYCCESKGQKFRKKIYFNKMNDNYVWFVCTLDLKFAEVDSLKNLTLKEKLSLTENGEAIYYDTMPFKFKAGKYYHLFGLEGIEGSYYLHVKDDLTFEVKYFDGGPF